jgi:hypothetical protein
MLLLILGIILLVIAGGVIVNPVIFGFAVLALAMFVMRLRHACGPLLSRGGKRWAVGPRQRREG